jgi:hypothetical protein
MKYCYPLKAQDTYTYSHRIRDYRFLTLQEKKVLINNFKEFYKYVFWWFNLPHPTRDQLAMAKYVSQLVNRQDPLMLQAQRGLAKSLTTQILSTWMLLRNKEEVISVISATSSRAESFITFVKQILIRVPLVKHLAPTGENRQSSRKIDVNGRIPNDSPSLSAFGVTSAKAGSRSSFLIYDDVEIPENSNTAQKREKLLDGVRDAANLGIAGVFRELAICTPQSAESVYNIMKNEDGFERRIIPAEYPEDISVYEGDLAPHILYMMKKHPKIIGEATDKRNNMAHLIKQKVKGKARYKLHYMLDTAMTDSERYPLKLSDLIVMDLDAETAPLQIIYSSDRKDTLYDIKHKGFRGDNLFKAKFVSEDTRKPYEGIAMFIDPSGRGKDETAYAISAQLNGKIFLLDFGGVSGGYDEDTLNTLADLASRFKVNVIAIESNFGDGSFHELMKPVLKARYVYGKQEGCEVIDVRANNQKEKRIIETLEPAMMQHRIIVNKQALVVDQEKKSDYSFTYQLTHLTEEANSLKHDDVVDVVEMSVAYWRESLARDDSQALESHRIDKLKLDLAKLTERRRQNSVAKTVSCLHSF